MRIYQKQETALIKDEMTKITSNIESKVDFIKDEMTKITTKVDSNKDEMNMKIDSMTKDLKEIMTTLKLK